MGIINKIHFNEKIPAGNLYIKLEVDLTKNQPNAMIFNYSNTQWGLGITDQVKLEYSWDEDEFLILFSELELELYDRYHNLVNSFLNPNFKELRIEISLNNTVIYSGYNYGEYILREKILNLNFRHKLSKLNELPVSIDGQFNYQFPPGKYNINSQNVYNLKELIQDFFRICYPIEIISYNAWNFWSVFYGSPPRRIECNFNQLGVVFRYVFITETGTGPQWACSNYMEALKSLLLSIGFWGGMINNNTVFVDSLFLTEEEQSGQIIECNIERSRSNYDYVEITRGLGMVWASRGQKSSINEKNKQIIIRGDIFRVPLINSYLNMAYIQKKYGAPIIDYSNFLGDLYGNYYLQHYQYTIKLKLHGINYVPYKKFLVENSYYIPKVMTINLILNHTEIEGIKIE